MNKCRRSNARVCRQKRFRLPVQFVRDLQTRPTEYQAGTVMWLVVGSRSGHAPDSTPSQMNRVRLPVSTTELPSRTAVVPSVAGRVESTHIGQHLVYLFHLLIYLPSKVGQKFPQELLVISALLHGLVPVDYTLGGHDCSLALCVVVSIGGVVSLLPLFGLMSGDFCLLTEMVCQSSDTAIRYVIRTQVELARFFAEINSIRHNPKSAAR